MISFLLGIIAGSALCAIVIGITQYVVARMEMEQTKQKYEEDMRRERERMREHARRMNVIALGRDEYMKHDTQPIKEVKQDDR
jgi:uncharacterized membrane protein (DUF106 family)